MKSVLCLLAMVLILGCNDFESPHASTLDDATKTAEFGVETGKQAPINFAGGEGEVIALTRGRAGYASQLKENAVIINTIMHDGDKKPAIDRKIIYNAEVYLVVEDLDAGEKQLKELIKQFDGKIANSDLRGSSGSQRSGHWKIRIPVANFDAFKAKVEKIGNLERSSTNSSDVTEEFYDIEARLKNKKIEEARLIQHLEKSTAKLSDILEVEKELSRVRGEIEQMQGRLNMLTNLTSLTTIDVTLREVKNYVPPTAPSFGDDVSRTLSGSWTGLVGTGRRFALNAVSVVPWIPLWIILGIVFYFSLRFLRRKSREKVMHQAPPMTA
ncbi:MAG TPA: DUF4349 domain-containing protein [Gemmatales bacterium]|nr:DUF4349 domain-containing protein [Gemmatales bacterium]